MENEKLVLYVGEAIRGDDIELTKYEGTSHKELFLKTEWFEEDGWDDNWKEQFDDDEKYRFVLSNGDIVELYDNGEIIYCFCNNEYSAKMGLLQHYSNTKILNSIIE